MWKDRLTGASELITDLEDLYPECEVVGIPLPIYFICVSLFMCAAPQKNDVRLNSSFNKHKRKLNVIK